MNNDTEISSDDIPKRVVNLLNRAGIRTLGQLKAAITIDPAWLSRIPGFGMSSLRVIDIFLANTRGRKNEDFSRLPKRLREAFHYLQIDSPEDLSIFLAENGEGRLLREPFIGRSLLKVAIEFAKFHDLIPISNQQRICNVVARWQAKVADDSESMKEIETVSRFFNVDLGVSAQRSSRA